MRITFLLPYADLSGGIKVVSIYAQRLKDRGHEVAVVSTPRKPMSLRQKFRYWRHGMGWPQPKKRGLSHMDRTTVTHKVIDCWRPIEARDVPDGDVVIATWWETAEWVWALPPEKGVKAYFIQGHEVFPGQPAERVAATWRLPMHRITISNWLIELGRTTYGDSDISLVPNSVDTQQFDAPPRGKQPTPTVGLLYSTTSVKGVEVALAALGKARQQMGTIKLVAFGAGPVSNLIPLPRDTEYTQQPPQDRIKELYAQCDVWLCGSRSEGFHLPPLEAMACRCPVVSTRVGGPLDIIRDGENGFLVDVGDADALAERMMRVLKMDETRWQAMSDAAYATARRYSWDDAADLFEAALEKAVAAGKDRQTLRTSIV